MRTEPSPSDLATAGKLLASWFLTADKGKLVGAVNAGVLKYIKIREDRKNRLGKPDDFYPKESEAPLPAQSHAEEETVAEQVVKSAGSALCYIGFLAARVNVKLQESWNTNSVVLYQGYFPVINTENVHLAFLYIGRLSNGWEVERLNGFVRASLTTLIFCEVFSLFVAEYFKPKMVTEGDTEFEVIEMEKETSDVPRVLGLIKSRLIDPEQKSQHAQKIFIGFSNAKGVEALQIELNKFLDALDKRAAGFEKR